MILQESYRTDCISVLPYEKFEVKSKERQNPSDPPLYYPSKNCLMATFTESSCLEVLYSSNICILFHTDVSKYLQYL